jgi:hypothetical protein
VAEPEAVAAPPLAVVAEPDAVAEPPAPPFAPDPVASPGYPAPPPAPPVAVPFPVAAPEEIDVVPVPVALPALPPGPAAVPGPFPLPPVPPVPPVAVASLSESAPTLALTVMSPPAPPAPPGSPGFTPFGPVVPGFGVPVSFRTMACVGPALMAAVKIIGSAVVKSNCFQENPLREFAIFDSPQTPDADFGTLHRLFTLEFRNPQYPISVHFRRTKLRELYVIALSQSIDRIGVRQQNQLSCRRRCTTQGCAEKFFGAKMGRRFSLTAFAIWVSILLAAPAFAQSTNAAPDLSVNETAFDPAKFPGLPEAAKQAVQNAAQQMKSGDWLGYVLAATGDLTVWCLNGIPKTPPVYSLSDVARITLETCEYGSGAPAYILSLNGRDT